MAEWYRRMFQGRYGIRKMSVVLLCIAAVFFIWALIAPPHWRKFSPVLTGVLLAVYAIWRCFSRNIVRRQQEEASAAYLLSMVRRKLNDLWSRTRFGYARNVVRPKKSKFGKKEKGKKMDNTEDSINLIVLCPNCNQQLRVPRGKGEIRITCKNCGKTFQRKT